MHQVSYHTYDTRIAFLLQQAAINRNEFSCVSLWGLT